MFKAMSNKLVIKKRMVKAKLSETKMYSDSFTDYFIFFLIADIKCIILNTCTCIVSG